MRTFAIVTALLVGLAGCVLAEEGRFPAHNETKSQEYPNFENLVLRGTLSGEGDEVTVSASAKNEGPHTYKVSSICSPSWFDRMESALGEVHRTEPMAYCAAWGLKEFKPGQSIPFQATWNGTLWNSQTNSYVDAAPGKYTWHLMFHAYKGGKEQGEFDTHDVIPLAFTVTVQ